MTSVDQDMREIFGGEWAGSDSLPRFRRAEQNCPMDRAQIFPESASVHMIGNQPMIHMRIRDPEPAVMLRLGACPAAGCGNLPDGAHARVCRRSDCGLSDRFHAASANIGTTLVASGKARKNSGDRR